MKQSCANCEKEPEWKSYAFVTIEGVEGKRSTHKYWSGVCKDRIGPGLITLGTNRGARCPHWHPAKRKVKFKLTCPCCKTTKRYTVVARYAEEAMMKCEEMIFKDGWAHDKLFRSFGDHGLICENCKI